MTVLCKLWIFKGRNLCWGGCPMASVLPAAPMAAAWFWWAGGLGLMFSEMSCVPKLEYEALRRLLGVSQWNQGREDKSRCLCALHLTLWWCQDLM